MRSNAALVQRLAQGPGDSDEDNETDERDEHGETYPNDFLSYQGTDLDTDLGSVYTLEFEAGSLEAAEEDEQDSDGEEFITRQSNHEAEIVEVPLHAPAIVPGPIELPTVAPVTTVLDILSQATAHSHRSALEGPVTISPVFVPTFWKKGERESFDGEFAQISGRASRDGPVSAISGCAVSHVSPAGDEPMTPHEPDSPLTAKVCVRVVTYCAISLTDSLKF